MALTLREDIDNISFAHTPGTHDVGQATYSERYATNTEGRRGIRYADSSQDSDASNALIVPSMCYATITLGSYSYRNLHVEARLRTDEGARTQQSNHGPTGIQPSRAAKGRECKGAGGVDQATPRAVKRKGDPIGGDEKRSRSSQGEASSSAQPRRDVVPRLSLPPTQHSTASSLPATTKAPRGQKPQEKKYRCTNCNKPKATFSAEYELNRHLEQCTNPGARPYKCWICPQKADGELVELDRHDALRRHSISKHPGERPPSKRDLN
ncbi:predicted protein [Postia placenta Mad-698-R]|nr:predicted protein [Postia placenta Mad-698-R]